jgi:hypothetical protein
MPALIVSSERGALNHPLHRKIHVEIHVDPHAHELLPRINQ